jgi:hypothetical protein
MNVEHLKLAYIEAMLWSTTTDDGDWLDGQYSLDDVSDDAMATIDKITAAFARDCGHLLKAANVEHPRGGSASEMAGHDLWLTTAGHGAGFWDGDWAEPAASAMTEWCRRNPAPEPYVGDDGKVHLS